MSFRGGSATLLAGEVKKCRRPGVVKITVVEPKYPSAAIVSV